LNDKIAHISSFSFEYRFLSNFYPCQVELDGVIYSSVEHAYQAAKTLNMEERKPFHQTPAISAAESKKLGRKLTLRPDWDDVKLQVMEDLLLQKFAAPKLREKLLQTGDQLLVEGNYWGDTFWGVDHKKGGLNHLGQLLMKIRKKL
jgi:ribA/ribD-fused uncharacterized protein